jgi:LAO/AO transport system kinase
MKKFDRAQLSKMISRIEARQVSALKSLKSFFSPQSLSRSICFTGPAGVGKSSLMAQLLPLAVKTRSIAWLACDPSSPVSGGSLLGDRIRMSGKIQPEALFIRSMSTRSTSAFSQSIRDVEVYLENFFDQVWVETAGSGQTQSEVAQISALTVLILQPETGDEIQWMKAGVREWADHFVVHKSDLPGAEAMMQSLLELGAKPEQVSLVSSKTGQGMNELLERLDQLMTDLNWKSRQKILHEELSRYLFLERHLKGLHERFDRSKKKWMKQPYA